MRGESMKKNNWLLVLLILIASGIIAPRAVFAQEYDYSDDDYGDEDEDNDEDGDDDSSEYYAEDDSYGAVGNLEDNAIGISNPDGRFTLAASPAALFKKMAEMERENAIMKLKIEREKLNLDLKRQRAEMKKVGLSLQEEEAARARRAAEDAFLAEEEVLRRQLEADRQQAEIARQQQENELNRRILDKITNADLSDPDQVSAVAQLLAFAPGATTTLPAVVRDQLSAGRGARAAAPEPEIPETLESKFTIRSIVGAGGKFTANLENKSTAAVVRLRQGSNLEGWTVASVNKDSVVLRREGDTQIIYMK